MMDYHYTAINRLITPHSYMYTAFNGGEFLKAYSKDRIKHLNRFSEMKSNGCLANGVSFLHLKTLPNLKSSLQRHNCIPSKVVQKYINLETDFNAFDFDNYQKENISPLSSFSIRNDIETFHLLQSLVRSQVDCDNYNLIKFWLDKLIQRFEVTKKIFEVYPQNFGKGKGKSSAVYLYWVFSLSLILHYDSTANVKYLNTAMKVVDLLCSLDEIQLVDNIPPESLICIVLLELNGIKLLAENIGDISFAIE